jgi:hypothetical protein
MSSYYEHEAKYKDCKTMFYKEGKLIATIGLFPSDIILLCHRLDDERLKERKAKIKRDKRKLKINV